MSDLDLKTLRETVKELAGPWSVSWFRGAIRHLVRNVDYECFWNPDPGEDRYSGIPDRADGAAIAKALNALPALLDEMERLRKERDEAREFLGRDLKIAENRVLVLEAENQRLRAENARIREPKNGLCPCGEKGAPVLATDETWFCPTCKMGHAFYADVVRLEDEVRDFRAAGEGLAKALRRIDVPSEKILDDLDDDARSGNRHLALGSVRFRDGRAINAALAQWAKLVGKDEG